MNVERLHSRHREQATLLLGELGVSLIGVRSSRLHAILVEDALASRIEARIALIAGSVKGIVVAAPAAYWWSMPLMHWGMAARSIRNRVSYRLSRGSPSRTGHPEEPAASPLLRPEGEHPARTWDRPGDAWRIVFIGTASDARGRGVAAELYRAVMQERSLVARIAAGNTASLRLHASLGWRLYRDQGVVLAVHELATVTPAGPGPAAARHADDRPASDSGKTARGLHS